MRRVALATLVVCLPVALWALLPVLSAGQSGKLGEIKREIDRKEAQIERKKATEGVLSTTIAAYTRRINALQSSITAYERREAVIEADLARKRAELERIQGDLRRERARLARLKARLAHARRVLSVRLVELYKAERPDIITVILNADGFAELIERSEFIERVNDQDTRIITSVREAKGQTERTTKKLAVLERRQRRITLEILAQRDEVARIRERLDGRRAVYARTRAGKNAVLAQVREQRHALEEDLAALEAEQAEVEARLAGASSGAAGPIRAGSGSLIWPINAPITSPFGQRWGRLHAGIDMGAGEGTPIRAADSGTVVIAGWQGGYGNYTCIQHGGSMSTCYAHQSSIGVSVGQSVSKGQVIGAVGNTGHSFGAHLHFEVRINGSPTDPMGYL